MKKLRRGFERLDPEKFYAALQDYLDTPVPDGPLQVCVNTSAARVAHSFKKYFPCESSYDAIGLRVAWLFAACEDPRLAPWLDEEGRPRRALIEAVAVVCVETSSSRVEAILAEVRRRS